MSEPLEPPPTKTARDKLVDIAAAGAAELPIAGTIVEVLRQVFGTAYEERQRAWVHQLYELVGELSEYAIDIEALAERPEFVTAVHEASRIAVGEHLEQKLLMLRSVLFSSALHSRTRINDLTTLRFLRWVDELEPEHVVALRRCQFIMTIDGKLHGSKNAVGDVDAADAAYGGTTRIGAEH